MSGVEVVAYGPLFDGRAYAAVDDACEDIAQTLARQGEDDVDAQLQRVLRTQTPYYRLQIASRQELPNTWLIHDSGVIYGPWLEGTGSRNKTTRFKGYRTFRIVAQRLRGKSRMMARVVLARYMERMN